MSETIDGACERCGKPVALCVCATVVPQPTRVHVLILQHPQEPDKELGTATIASIALPNSTLRVGLSWPNLHAAVGRDVNPARWLVLYLGSGTRSPCERALTVVSKKGEPVPDQATVLGNIEGLVVLDGTWSQAKALWWRNAWLLKLRRGILVPRRPSLYGKLRREPRRECLSTIESIGAALSELGEPASTEEHLREVFGRLLGRARDRRRSGEPRA